MPQTALVTSSAHLAFYYTENYGNPPIPWHTASCLTANKVTGNVTPLAAYQR